MLGQSLTELSYAACGDKLPVLSVFVQRNHSSHFHSMYISFYSGGKVHAAIKHVRDKYTHAVNAKAINMYLELWLRFLMAVNTATPSCF